MDPNPGVPGTSKDSQGPLNALFEVWRNNIISKLKSVQNILRKQIFFLFNFDDFLKFLPFGGNLNSLICKRKSDFLTPLGALEVRPYIIE